MSLFVETRGRKLNWEEKKKMLASSVKYAFTFAVVGGVFGAYKSISNPAASAAKSHGKVDQATHMLRAHCEREVYERVKGLLEGLEALLQRAENEPEPTLTKEAYELKHEVARLLEGCGEAKPAVDEFVSETLAKVEFLVEESMVNPKVVEKV